MGKLSLIIARIIIGQDIVDEFIIINVIPVSQNDLFLDYYTIDDIESVFNINISTTQKNMADCAVKPSVPISHRLASQLKRGLRS